MSSKKKYNSFLVQGSILAIASIITRIIGLLYRVPLTNIIGLPGNDYYGSAYDIYSMVLLISSYSIPLAVSKEMSAKIALKQYRNAKKIFNAAMIYAVVVGGAAALITFGISFFIKDGMALALRVLSPTIFFSAILGVFRGYFQGHGSMMPTSISQIIEQIMNAIGSVLMAWIMTRPYVALATQAAQEKIYVVGAAGSAAGTGIGVVIGLIFVILIYVMYQPRARRRIIRDHTRVENSYRDIFILILLTITPVIFSTFIYNISGSLDMILYKWLVPKTGLPANIQSTFLGTYYGHYKVLINVPIALASAISTAMIPSITAAIARNETEEANSKVDMSIKFTMLISIPAAFGIAALARPILTLLFRSTITDTSVKLLILGAVTIILYALSTVTNGVLQGIGKLKIPVYHSIISLILHVIVLVPLLYLAKLHVYAILIATMFFAFNMCCLNQIALKKHLDYSMDYLKVFVIPGICSLIMAGASYGVYHGLYTFIHSNSFCLAIAIVVAVIVYFILMLLLKGITESELKQFPKGTLLLKAAKKCKLIR